MIFVVGYFCEISLCSLIGPEEFNWGHRGKLWQVAGLLTLYLRDGAKQCEKDDVPIA